MTNLITRPRTDRGRYRVQTRFDNNQHFTQFRNHYYFRHLRSKTIKFLLDVEIKLGDISKNFLFTELLSKLWQKFGNRYERRCKLMIVWRQEKRFANICENIFQLKIKRFWCINSGNFFCQFLWVFQFPEKFLAETSNNWMKWLKWNLFLIISA